MSNMSKLFLVCGLSGNGKTYYSKQFAENNGYLRVDPDEIYAMFNGTEINHTNVFEVWQTLFLIVHTAEKNGIDVVLDTNALTISQRNQFVEWFPTFEKHIVVIECPRIVRRYNVKNRTRTIPDKIMDKMESNYERPMQGEFGWCSVIYMMNNSNHGFYPINIDEILDREKLTIKEANV